MEASRAADMKTQRSGNLRNPLSTAERFPCTSPTINTEQHCELLGFLPPDYQYHVCRYRAVSQSAADDRSFEATVRMSLRSKEQIVSWLRSMKVTWRVAHTRPTRGHRILFKADYRCQFNSPPREKLQTNRSSINTNCPAKLRVTLVRTEGSRGQRSRNTDPHIPEYPTLVDISNVHNHNTHVPGKEVTTATAHAPQVLHRTVLSSTLREFSAVAQSSAGFRRAAAAMMQSFHRLKGNPAALQAAMHTFGRHGTDHPTSLPGRSSVSRPEVELGGRRRLGGGRRKKMVPTPDAEAAMSGCDSSST